MPRAVTSTRVVLPVGATADACAAGVVVTPDAAGVDGDADGDGQHQRGDPGDGLVHRPRDAFGRGGGRLPGGKGSAGAGGRLGSAEQQGEERRQRDQDDERGGDFHPGRHRHQPQQEARVDDDQPHAREPVEPGGCPARTTDGPPPITEGIR
jgi:hypothetical protein